MLTPFPDAGAGLGLPSEQLLVPCRLGTVDGTVDASGAAAEVPSASASSSSSSERENFDGNKYDDGDGIAS